MYYTCISMNANQNIHLLLPKTDLFRLKKQAKSRGESIGALIREAIHKVYGSVEPVERKSAFERLAQRHELTMTDWEEVKKDLLHRYD